MKANSIQIPLVYLGLKTMTVATARKRNLQANAAATMEKQATQTPKKLGYTMPGKTPPPLLTKLQGSTNRLSCSLSFCFCTKINVLQMYTRTTSVTLTASPPTISAPLGADSPNQALCKVPFQLNRRRI